MSKGRTKAAEENDIQNSIAIRKWLMENKHKFKHGVSRSIPFSGVVFDRVEGSYFPANVGMEDPRYNRYSQYVYRLKNRGYLKYEPETVGGQSVWSVVESKIPADKLDYTGVRTHIPMAEEPKHAIQGNTTSLQKFQNEGKAFIEEELKNITVQFAVVHRKGMDFKLKNPTLYQLYKLGLTLNEIAEEDNGQATTVKQEGEADRVPEAESEPEGRQTLETENPF